MLGSSANDFRIAIRSLLRSPGFFLTAVLTLALGMSAATIVFSAINAILLRPLPVRDPAGIVAVSTVGEMTFLQQEPLSFEDVEAITANVPAFGAVLAHRREPMAIGSGIDSRVALGERVSPAYFTELGVSMPLGRGFAADDAPADVVVLSHLHWRQRFASDPGVIGRRLELGSRGRTVIGVAPEGFTGLFRGIAPEFWVPMDSSDEAPAVRGDAEWWVHARLANAGGVEQARAELGTLARVLAERDPVSHQGRSFRIERLSDASAHPALPRALLNGGALAVLAVALLLLLVATVNVANLVLARASMRQREIAVRTAMGATRWRVIRAQLAEGAVLAGAAAVLGLLIAQWAGQALRVVPLPVPVGIDLNLTLDWRVFIFTSGLTALTTLLFSTGPALRTSSVPLAPVLAQAGRSGMDGRSRWRSVFLSAQAMVAMLLIVLGGLALRSLLATTRVDPGFVLDRAIVAATLPGLAGYEKPRALAYLDEGAARVRALPGVEGAAWIHPLPLSLNIRISRLRMPGQEAVNDAALPYVDAAVAWPQAFRTLGVPLLDGREFDERDREGQPATALVNRAFAERFWPGQSALGQRMAVGFPVTIDVQVVGVVEDFKNRTLGDVRRPMVFTSGLQDSLGWQGATLVVRQSERSGASLASVAAALRDVDAAVPLFDVQSLETRVGGVMLLPRYAAGLFGSIGAFSLLLIAVGLFGIVSFWAQSRTRELGLRIALGSRRDEILWLVISQTMAPVVVGGAIGLGVALFAARALSILLTGVSPQDPITLMIAVALLGATAVAAGAWPAWKASRLDPIAALRTE